MIETSSMSQGELFDHNSAIEEDFPLPTITGKNAKRELRRLSQALDAARVDLETAEYNLCELQMHWDASSADIIDANWWDGAMRLGITSLEWGKEYPDGHYPLRLRHWIRHLIREQNYARGAALDGIRILEPRVALLKSLEVQP